VTNVHGTKQGGRFALERGDLEQTNVKIIDELMIEEQWLEGDFTGCMQQPLGRPPTPGHGGS